MEKKNNQANKENSKKPKERVWVLYLAAQSTQDVGKSCPNPCSDSRRANPCRWCGQDHKHQSAYRVKVSLLILRPRFVLSED